MSAPRRLTWAARLALSGLLSPPAVAAGQFAFDAGHPYVGGVAIAYGVTWGVVALIAAGACGMVGFTTDEYNASLREARSDNEKLRAQLRAETALREKFQAALTDGEVRP